MIVIIGELDLSHFVQYNAALPFAVTAIVSDILIAAALCVVLDGNRSEFEECVLAGPSYRITSHTHVHLEPTILSIS